jgi:hypothetical protein
VSNNPYSNLERYLKSIDKSLKRIADAIGEPEAPKPEPESTAVSPATVAGEAVPRQLSRDDELTMSRSTGGPLDDANLDPLWMTEEERAEAESRRVNG